MQKAGSMREWIIGIDLGTTNSEVACIVDGKPYVIEENDDGIVPSCVGLDAQGNLLVGRAALNQWAGAPERTVRSVKRKMGSNEQIALGKETFSPQEISAVILKSLKARAERFLGQAVHKAVITVPAYFTDAQRQATRDAGTIAGLEVVRILNEPTAAALAYQTSQKEARTLLVYDLGGGTFDVSVVRSEAGVVEVLASTGDTCLGGDDFDRALAEHLKQSLPTKEEDFARTVRLLRAAEEGKKALSFTGVTRICEDHLGLQDGRPIHLDVELLRDELERLLEPFLQRTLSSITQALTDAKLTAMALDDVILVGGSTRIPMISELITRQLGHVPHGEIDPDRLVALGAALQAGLEMGLAVGATLVDITPYTFGTRALSDHGSDMYVPIIRRNTKLPVERSNLFYTIWDDQDRVQVEVYQGEDQDIHKNKLLGEFRFDGLNQKNGAREKGITFTYQLDLNGVLQVRAVERATGKELTGTIENALGRLSQDKVQAATAKVVSLCGDQQEHAANLDALLQRAQKALAKASADDQKELTLLMEQLQTFDPEGRSDAQKALEDLLFYLD
jgi:molecular chaperone DnaK (HSP70)